VTVDEQPKPFAIAFYRMVDSASELVHEKTTRSRLSAFARLLAIKSRHNMSIAEYDDIIGIINELLPPILIYLMTSTNQGNYYRVLACHM
jgi:hypothetical protein